MQMHSRCARMLLVGFALSLSSIVQSFLCAANAALPALPASAPIVTPLRSYRDGYVAPSAIATDSAGRVYITDSALGKIFVRDEFGRLVSVKSGLSRPLGIAVDAAGRIFVGEAGTGSVSVFLPDWSPLGKLGQGAGEFQMPNHLAIPTSGPLAGMVLVSDSRADLIKIYSPGGSLIRQFGGSGTAVGLFNFPSGIFVNADGEIFVADQNNNRIQVFSPVGGFLRSFGRSTLMGLGPFSRTQGLTGDSSGRIFVADAFQGTVKVIDGQGNAVSTVARFGEGPGELRTPTSLTIDRNNRLFVVSPGNTRVEIFGLDAFSDPKGLPAVIKLLPSTFERNSIGVVPAGGFSINPNVVVGLVRVVGAAPEMILLESITANGVPARHFKGIEISDFDGDGNAELRMTFDRRRLVATLPDGKGVVLVKGSLADGQSFEGSVAVYVAPGGGGGPVPVGASVGSGSGQELEGGSR
ncbi:MAG: NHL repeat-containing protein [Holophagaceae bacterium]|nr:NHL repeat-containing protein [Holophagaceae bacterium]